jgi:hypothetical protein
MDDPTRTDHDDKRRELPRAHLESRHGSAAEALDRNAG